MSGFGDHFYESSDGLSLHYRDYAKRNDRPDARAASGRAPVVCLPGLTRNARDFASIAEHLAADRRVLCLEFRGRGSSQYDSVVANYAPPTYANDVVTLLDDLKIERAVLLGTSLGGLVSMLVAAMVPARLAGVILNDMGAVVEKTGLERISSYAGRQEPVDSWSRAADQARATNEPAFPGRSEDWWIDFARKAYRENPDGTIALDYDPAIGESLRSARRPTDPNAGWSLYEALMPIPTLLLRGETSDILSNEIALEMKNRKADLVLAEIQGVGHAPILDEPDAIAAIDAFLATR